MGEQNVVDAYNEMLSSLTKEWNFDICYDVDEPQKHYAYWGTWLAQLVQHVDSCLWVVSSSPTLGVEYT